MYPALARALIVSFRSFRDSCCFCLMCLYFVSYSNFSTPYCFKLVRRHPKSDSMSDSQKVTLCPVDSVLVPDIKVLYVTSTRSQSHFSLLPWWNPVHLLDYCGLRRTPKQKNNYVTHLLNGSLLSLTLCLNVHLFCVYIIFYRLLLTHLYGTYRHIPHH